MILTFIFCLFSLFQFLPRNYCCDCPKPTYHADLSISSEDQIIDGLNYGRLIYMNNMIFLTNDSNASFSSGNLIHECPKGSPLIIIPSTARNFIKFWLSTHPITVLFNIWLPNIPIPKAIFGIMDAWPLVKTITRSGLIYAVHMLSRNCFKESNVF